MFIHGYPDSVKYIKGTEAIFQILPVYTLMKCFFEY